MEHPAPTPADPAVWVVDAIVAAEVVLAGGDSLTRAGFLEAAWELLDGTGLMGIHEGTIDVGDAFAAGISDSALVIDEAAAPPRDWVAKRALADVEFWFPSGQGARDAATRLVRVVGCALVGIREEAPRDWAAESRATIQPIAIPGFGRVVPPWHACDAGPPALEADRIGTTIVIDPGIGFGTGMHPTTRLCLAAIAAPAGATRGDRVLDFGSGSGILAIAAALLGAAHVDAVEVDHRVHDAIRRNARLNGVEERLAIHAELPEGPATRPYDLVVANIVAAVLVAHAEELVARVRGGGELVLSGLLAADLPAVRKRYGALGAPEPSIVEEGGWFALLFSFPGAAG